ncbi:helix-turn-helix domain-containing protein [Nocardioides sp. P5_C9_2]
MPGPRRRSFQESAIQRAFGERVRASRVERGWTQEALAEHSGLDRSFIAQIESGSRNPSLATIARLAAGLQVNIADLFSDERA